MEQTVDDKATTGNPWLDLGNRMVSNFEERSEAFMELLVTGFCLRPLLLMVYNEAVRVGLEPPIEKLAPAEKQQLWSDAKGIAAGRMNHEQCIELSKCLYTIKSYLGK